MNSACPRRVSLITAKGTAVHSVSNHRRNDRGSPGCQRFYSRPDRLRLSLADSPIHTDRIEFTATSHPGTPVLRTGRSRCVALHPGLLRRSYASIPHGASPRRGGLSPPYPLALSGARARPSRSHPSRLADGIRLLYSAPFGESVPHDAKVWDEKGNNVPAPSIWFALPDSGRPRPQRVR